MKQYSEVVERIHKEFKTYGDNLIAEANEILDKTSATNLAKVERLKKIGFTSVKEVVETEGVIAERRAAEKQAELVRYYQQKYPFQKFVTQEGVDRICAKYNLVNAPISRYTGFVPDVKLKEIERFKSMDVNHNEDHVGEMIKVTQCWSSKFKSLSREREKCMEEFRNIFPEWIPIDMPGMNLRTINANIVHEDGYIWIERYEKRHPSNEFIICAPQKDFDLKDLKKQGFSFFKSVTVSVPDPVVLQAVKGGYLVIAAWGDEASDPEVVNQIFN